MKLCHIVPSLQEQHGGPSKSVRALCRALSRAGHTVELLATAPDVPDDGVEIERTETLRIRLFRRDRPSSLCVSRGLAAALATTKADVIQHHALWLRTLHYARRRADQLGAPLVISPRGMMSRWAWRHHRGRKALAAALVHPGALPHAAGWHCTSAAEASEVGELGFRQPSCVAPNGVDAPSEAERAAAREHWHAECPETLARPTALFYGRFHRKKRVIELIDTWLESAPRDWLLLLVGIPEDYSPATLEQYVHRCSGSGRVAVFSGEARPAPYAVASLFLLPSHSENFGLTVAEAMAGEVPALVTDSTPWQGLNTDARGWCVPWQDYATALKSATAEPPDSLRARGRRARDWVLREYSWDAAARQLSDFYLSLRKPLR